MKCKIVICKALCCGAGALTTVYWLMLRSASTEFPGTDRQWIACSNSCGKRSRLANQNARGFTSGSGSRTACLYAATSSGRICFLLISAARNTIVEPIERQRFRLLWVEKDYCLEKRQPRLCERHVSNRTSTAWALYTRRCHWGKSAESDFSFWKTYQCTKCY